MLQARSERTFHQGPRKAQPLPTMPSLLHRTAASAQLLSSRPLLQRLPHHRMQHTPCPVFQQQWQHPSQHLNRCLPRTQHSSPRSSRQPVSRPVPACRQWHRQVAPAWHHQEAASCPIGQRPLLHLVAACSRLQCRRLGPDLAILQQEQAVQGDIARPCTALLPLRLTGQMWA